MQKNPSSQVEQQRTYEQITAGRLAGGSVPFKGHPRSLAAGGCCQGAAGHGAGSAGKNNCSAQGYPVLRGKIGSDIPGTSYPCTAQEQVQGAGQQSSHHTDHF